MFGDLLNSHSRRRRARHRFRKRVRRLKHLLFVIIVLAVLSLAALNGTVRYFGGNPDLFSIKFLNNKTYAIAHLGWHHLWHWQASCDLSSQALLIKAAKKHGVPARVVLAIARTESHFKPHLISSAGAMGVMQMIPSTSVAMGTHDPFDKADNIEGGVRYLSQLWRLFGGDVKRVAAAYNAGPGAVRKRGMESLPRETRHYVVKVMRGVARR